MRRNVDRSPAVPIAGDEVGIGTIVRAVWRNKRSIIGPVLLMTAAAYIGVNQLTPRYKSEARVLVEGRENIFLRPEAEKSGDRGGDQEGVAAQVQLVLSRNLALDVIQRLKLEENKEFNAALREGSRFSLLQHLGLAKDPKSLTTEELVLAAYYERLQAFSVEKSRVIAIEFQSANTALAAQAANVIAEKYIELQQLNKQNQARAAGQWLSGELETLRKKVLDAEAKAEEYRAKSNLFLGINNNNLSNQQLTELSSQVTAARTQKADAEARARMIRDAMRAGQSLDSFDSELIRRLSEQRVTLRAQLAEQSSTLLPQHPRIREMRAQIADLSSQITAEGERLVRSLDSEAKVAGARLEALSANLDQLKRQTASTSDQDVQLRALDREAKSQRDLFESYLAKYREATARDSIAAAPADARIISRAVVSNVPYFPKKGPIILIVAFGTLFLSSAVVVTSALLSGGSYRAPQQLVVPQSPAPAWRPASARTRSTDKMPAAHNLHEPPSRSLAPVEAGGAVGVSSRTVGDIALAIQQSEPGSRRVVLMGRARDVGTTLTAIALARSLAETGRVVLVDLSLASPNIDVISSDPTAPGIADMVRGIASFGDIITKDRFSRVHLVAAGAVGHDAEGLMNSQMLSAAVGALAQSYDYLVIDSGAHSRSTVAPLAAMAAHAVLVGGDVAESALTPLVRELKSAGFATVTSLIGPPPVSDPVVAQTSAA